MLQSLTLAVGENITVEKAKRCNMSLLLLSYLQWQFFQKGFMLSFDALSFLLCNLGTAVNHYPHRHVRPV